MPLKIKQALQDFGYTLFYIDALPQLTLLGAIIGGLTSLIIIAFRLAIEAISLVLGMENSESFETLTREFRVAIIIIGTLILAVFLHWLKPHDRAVGVSHILDRLYNHQAIIPLKNCIVQFIGGVVTLASGQPVGKEGPIVHLGAGGASIVGQWLKLPNNSIHVLIGCGVAAAISASFNTPMAGVIFAMEVIVLEYSIAGFLPVILSSVIGAVIYRYTFGDAPLFDSSMISNISTFELPLVVILGLVISALAGIYIRLNLMSLAHGAKIPIGIRIFIAGILVATCSYFIPEVMGLGYDTIRDIFEGNMAFTLLLTIALVKLFTAPIVIGLGIPGGLIGPSLFIGASLGAAFGMAAEAFQMTSLEGTTYALLGMAAMMAAVIDAPLAALVAVLELSNNSAMIMPCMLAVVVSCISTRQLIGLESIFKEQLKAQNKNLRILPAEQALRRAGVRSILDKSFVMAHQHLNYDEANQLLRCSPRWIVIEKPSAELTGDTLLHAADLANYLETAPETVLTMEEDIDLQEIPGRRLKLVHLHETANLLEALWALEAHNGKAVCISCVGSPTITGIRGIITLADIEDYYQPRHH